MTTTVATGSLILTASVPQTLPSTLPVPTTLQVAPPTSSPTGVPVISLRPLTVHMTSSTTTTPTTSGQNQTNPHLPFMPVNSTAAIPVSRILPNLSARSSPTVTNSPSTQPRILLPPIHPMITAISWKHPKGHDARKACNYWRDSLLRTTVSSYSPYPISYNRQSSSSFPGATAAPFIPSGSSAVLQPSPTHFSLQHVAQLLASTKKDHLPEWKLSEYNEDPIHWH